MAPSKLFTSTALLGCLALAGTPALAASPQAIGLSELSDESRECVECHYKEPQGLYQQWGASKHYRGNVGCYECHMADAEDPDAIRHYDFRISVLVTPKDCARCHSREVKEFSGSHHALAGSMAGSADHYFAEVVEGNRSALETGITDGSSLVSVNACWQCHGSTVKVGKKGALDPATWPNSGIGRINPDGSLGSCTACHGNHQFSVAQARHPDTCGKCHMGPDHPQREIYGESKHGIAFFAHQDEMNLDREKWIPGEDYHQAPTCASCHMSATRQQPVTHNTGLRISWNNRSELSVRPEVTDAHLDLPSKVVPHDMRRQTMTAICLSCHARPKVEGFYAQYDGMVALYHRKFAEPSRELLALARPLLRPVMFGNRIEMTWYEMWHRAGRRLRQGASMMGPEFVHGQGTLPLARDFYFEFVPELERLVAQNLTASEPDKVTAAQALQAGLERVLGSVDHQWFTGGMDPEEAAQRARAAEAFRARYGHD